MNTQCLTVYNLDQIVEQMNAEVVEPVKAKNVSGYHIMYKVGTEGGEEFRESRDAFLFVKGRDMVVTSTDTNLSYMNTWVKNLKLLAAE